MYFQGFIKTAIDSLIFDKIFIISDGLPGWNEQTQRWHATDDNTVFCRDIFCAMGHLVQNGRIKRACVLAGVSQFQTLNGKAFLEFCLANKVKCVAVSNEKRQIAGVDVYSSIEDFFENVKSKHDAVEFENFRVTTEEINALLQD